jgi:hypothetical protein
VTSLLLAASTGAQEPRVSIGARPRVSDGPDAIELAAGYGLVLDPWQQLVITDWLGIGEDGRWACPRCGLAVPRQNGKNSLLEARELFGAVMLGERILHTAHEVKTANKHFKRLQFFFDNKRQYPDLHAMVTNLRLANGETGVFLENGGSIELAARSTGSGRGFSVDTLVADEAQDLTDDEIAALLPTISASDNPQVILAGTPPKPAAARGEVFARVRQEALAA